MNKTRPINKTAWILGVVAATALLIPASRPARATPKLGETMNLTCTTCHDKPGSKLLTDQGKYYEAVGTLEGFEEVISSFRACTTCHVRKPGSEKLTRAGRVFSRTISDMHELKQWVAKQHPVRKPAEEEPAEKDPTEEGPDS